MENIFSLGVIQRFWNKSLEVTNKSLSQGISYSLSLEVFEGEGEWDLEDWSLCSLTTWPPLTIMVRFVGQSTAMCPKPKHLKHFLLEVLVGDLDVGVEGLESLEL